MKYKSFILSLFLFYAVNGATQSLCSKGTFTIGTNLITYNPILNSTTTSYRNDTMISKNSRTIHGISYAINFQVGYFVRNNLCIGVAFPDLGSLSNNSILLTTEIYARYYIRQKNHPFSLHDGRMTWYVEGSLVGGYNTISNNIGSNSPFPDPETISDFYGNAGIAFSYLVTKGMAFDVLGLYEIGYNSTINQDSKYIGSKDKSVEINDCFNTILRLEIFL